MITGDNPGDKDSLSNFELREFAKTHGLSPRETEIVGLLARRVVHFKDIARELTVSPSTVNNHFKSIFDKTKTNSKSELLASFLKFVMQKYEHCRVFYRRPEVLVVDDEPEICEIIADSLSDKGISVHTCCDPLEVLPMLQERRIDVVVSDIRMPKLDGLQLLKQIRSGYKYFPFVLFVSGFSSHHDVAEIMNMGAVDLLPKPLDINVLFARIMEHFIDDVRDRDRYLRVDAKIPIKLPQGAITQIQNIGYGGVFIPTSDDSLKVGDVVNFEFSLDDGDKPVSAVGEVVWRRALEQRGLPKGVGVRFTTISQRDRQRVLEFVRLKKILSFVPMGAAG